MHFKKLPFIILICFTPVATMAQKAYETFIYKGKVNNLSVILTYADGYMVGSKIRVINLKTKKISLFLPSSGEEDNKHQLDFYRFSTKETYNKAQYILLGEIDENTEAPKRIMAKYYEGGKTLPFTLTR